MQQIDFIGNLELDNGAIMFFFIEETKEYVLNFSPETV